MLKTAVILAAGNGTRLAGAGTSAPPSKPLTELAGIPLVVRTLMALESSGFQRAVVVTGYRAEEVEAALASDPRVRGIELVFARNERWRAKNGISVLAARPFVEGDEFYLTMSDHVFERRILDILDFAPLPERGALLAVDRKLHTIYDMDDATKVLTGKGSSIQAIGKELRRFDAVDTGLFRCSTALFDALDRAARAKGDCSLSDGVGALAAAGRMKVVDIEDCWWQDVDTPGAMAHAMRLLWRAVKFDPEGIFLPMHREEPQVMPLPTVTLSGRAWLA